MIRIVVASVALLLLGVLLAYWITASASKSRAARVTIPLLVMLLGVAAGGALLSLWTMREDPLRYLFFPPKDFYAPLVSTAIDVREAGKEYRFEYVHKYPLRYSVDLVVPRMSDPYETAYLDLDLSFRFLVDGKQLLASRINKEKEIAPFWGGAQGFAVFVYEVPRDLPRDVTVECRVGIMNPSKLFVDSYGIPTLQIAHDSVE